jgi:hypothetical protein
MATAAHEEFFRDHRHPFITRPRTALGDRRTDRDSY